MRSLFLKKKRYPLSALVVAALAAAMLLAYGLAFALRAAPGGSGGLDCRSPRPGEELRVRGSADGRPFCIYYPVRAYGEAP